MTIHGKTALVTGANRGIGLALVGALLDRGAARVYAAGRQSGALQAAVALDPARVIPLRLDVTDGADRLRAARLAADVSLLFNNAGALEAGSVLDSSSNAIARSFEVNCFGPLQVTRALVPALVANHGAVVNVLTIVALASIPGVGVYNASKAAAWSITQSLRADLARQGVRVFGVFPGPVDTDMIRGFDVPKTSPAAVAAAILDGIEADSEDIFPDPTSQSVYAQWVVDHKAVEQQFAAR